MTVRPFRADHVGSLLRPKRLKEARFKFNNNELSLEELTRIEDEEIERIIEKQIEIGLHSITDGEFRRSWWHFDFLENINGVEGYTPDHGLEFEGVETRAHNVRIVDKVSFNPITHTLNTLSFYIKKWLVAQLLKYQYLVQINCSILIF